MAASARKEIIRPGQPGIFHCWNRCVRRAYLMGKDPLSGKDYSHRRGWVTRRLELLVANFVIDVAFLGLLSNHLHLVLRANPRLADRMGAQEVARRWLRVFPGKRVLDDHWVEPTDQQVEALAADKKRIAVLRKRLSDISWFMAASSEYIARRANQEDGCTGRFWEGRFSCREVTSEGALLVCGLYVDLNPIRAGEAPTPEKSLGTSAWYRIQGRLQSTTTARRGRNTCDGWLAPLTLRPHHMGEIPSRTGRRASDKGLLTIPLDDYLRLLDWSGRQVRERKRGAIPSHLAPILERLGVDGQEFLATVEHFPKLFPRLAGRVADMESRAKEAGRRWLHGVRTAAKVFK